MMYILEYFNKLLLIVLTCYNCIDFPDYDSNDYCNHDMAKNPLACYWNTSDTLKTIIDESPPKGNSIFFLDTSCDSHKFGRIIVKKRLACAAESAARLHPNRSVYILYTSPGIVKYESGEYGDILRALLNYQNIQFLHVNFIDYLEGTPVQHLSNAIIRTPVKYPIYLASDVLRWVTLWKYGGIYLDDDVIVIKSFDGLPRNFVGAENNKSIACGVLGFSPDGDGHDYTTMCLKHLNADFSMMRYKRNGPAAITKLAIKLCGTKNLSAMHVGYCKQLKVLRPYYFYPVSVNRWADYYRADQMESIVESAKDSYTLHLWNFQSGNHRFFVDANGPYVQFARKYCPRVIERANEYM